MVCSLGNGRMAVMARILAAGSVSSQNLAVEIGRRQSVAKCMYRELHEADEPNLLDEEDMHVFGVEPMTDPLHLVCCNACKKPVKASQYAAHSGYEFSVSSVFLSPEKIIVVNQTKSLLCCTLMPANLIILYG
ncbi:unnamed protein product [Linum trigynum]|uniref:Uncharacterized protein n=1 Tax=Linum trigynum TaxID=586398 RepID=A0AAV2FG11_9ROSI